MRALMKRGMTLLLALLVLMPAVALAAQVVWDGAGLLDAEELASLSEDLSAVMDEAGLFCGVITISTAGGVSIEDYADRFYHDNKLGTGDDRDGVALFVNMGERDVYIYTYGRAIDLYPDARIEKMLDAVAPSLSEKQYADAFGAFVEKVRSYAAAGVPVGQFQNNTDTGEVSRYEKPVEQPAISLTSVLIAFAVALGVAGLACAGVAGKYKLIFVKDSYPFREKGKLRITRHEDTFLTKHVTRRTIQTNSGGGGGSTTRSSVGGGSHGGGGRKF